MSVRQRGIETVFFAFCPPWYLFTCAVSLVQMHHPVFHLIDRLPCIRFGVFFTPSCLTISLCDMSKDEARHWPLQLARHEVRPREHLTGGAVAFGGPFFCQIIIKGNAPSPLAAVHVEGLKSPPGSTGSRNHQIRYAAGRGSPPAGLESAHSGRITRVSPHFP